MRCSMEVVETSKFGMELNTENGAGNIRLSQSAGMLLLPFGAGCCGRS